MVAVQIANEPGKKGRQREVSHAGDGVCQRIRLDPKKWGNGKKKSGHLLTYL